MFAGADVCFNSPSPHPLRLSQFLFLMKKVNEWQNATRYEKFKDGAKRGRLGRARKQYLRVTRPKKLKAEEEAERIKKEEQKEREMKRHAQKIKREMQQKLARERHAKEKEMAEERGGGL